MNGSQLSPSRATASSSGARDFAGRLTDCLAAFASVY